MSIVSTALIVWVCTIHNRVRAIIIPSMRQIRGVRIRIRSRIRISAILVLLPVLVAIACLIISSYIISSSIISMCSLIIIRIRSVITRILIRGGCVSLIISCSVVVLRSCIHSRIRISVRIRLRIHMRIGATPSAVFVTASVIARFLKLYDRIRIYSMTHTRIPVGSVPSHGASIFVSVVRI